MINLTEDHKQLFNKKVQLRALKIPNKLIQTFRKTYEEHLYHESKPISCDAQHKLIALSNNDEGGIPEALQQFINTNAIQMQEVTVQRSYKDFTYNEILKELLPPDIEPPQGYETVGQIAHFNLKPEQIKYSSLIGQVLLDKNKQIRTVVNKTEKLHNVFRTPTLELMAGENDYSACVPEGGCRFDLNFERVYWCTRLYSERTRVLQFIKPNEVILDLFCGIGPFAIRAAQKLKCLCIANDLNPECFKFLQKNIIENRVNDKVIPLNMDAREVVKLFYQDKQTLEALGITSQYQEFDHVYMNLPVLAMDFLDVFRGFQKKVSDWNKQLPMIHVYGFIKAQTDQQLLECIEIRIKLSLPNFTKNQIEHFQIVKNVTAKKKMVCVSFRLNELDASSLDVLEKVTQIDIEEDDEGGEYIDQDEDPQPNKKVKPNVN